MPMNGRTDFLPKNNGHTNYYVNPGGKSDEGDSGKEHNYFYENPAFFLINGKKGCPKPLGDQG